MAFESSKLRGEASSNLVAPNSDAVVAGTLDLRDYLY